MIRAQPLIHRAREEEEYDFAEGCRILETWNQTRDPDLSIARARVAPGVTTRLHRLEETTERYLILRGTGRVEVGNLPPKVVVPGDLVYIPPGCPQRITNTGEDDLLFLAICSPRFVPEVYLDIDSGQDSDDQHRPNNDKSD